VLLGQHLIPLSSGGAQPPTWHWSGRSFGTCALTIFEKELITVLQFNENNLISSLEQNTGQGLIKAFS